MPTPATSADAAAWEKTRHAFAKSILVDTPVASLAADLDGPPWPVNAPDETPASYICLPYAQAVAALAARGLTPARLGQLIEILNETAAFDEPFGDMTDLSTLAAGGGDAGSPLRKNLSALGLPSDFPLCLSALSEGTLELCRLEKADTLGGFVDFAGRVSQAVIVGGDFRDLLNAIAHRDDKTLARLLPYRPGARGLHLIEGIALEASRLDPATRAAVASDPLAASAALRRRVSRLAAWFPDQLDALRAEAAAGAAAALLVAPLADAALRPATAGLLQPHLPAPPSPPKPRPFWRRLLRLA